MAATIVRSDPAAGGIRRRRCGRGFSYLGTDAAVIKDSQILTRIRSLVIPPAWDDVWICADPLDAAALVIAASDGLQIQWLLDPGDVDVGRSLSILERLFPRTP